jgi:hypothetical protein
MAKAIVISVKGATAAKKNKKEKFAAHKKLKSCPAVWTVRRAGPSDTDEDQNQLCCRSGGPCVGNVITVLLG